MNETNNTVRSQGDFQLAAISCGKLSQPVILAGEQIVCTLPAITNAAGKVNSRGAEIAANAYLLAAASDLEDLAHNFLRAMDRSGNIPKIRAVQLYEMAERAVMKSRGLLK